MEQRVPMVGETVVFHDPTGRPHNALITNVWSNTMINLVHMSGDAERQDSYGRQIERVTSLQHKSVNSVHGFYWRFAEEEPNPYIAPQQS